MGKYFGDPFERDPLDDLTDDGELQPDTLERLKRMSKKTLDMLLFSTEQNLKALQRARRRLKAERKRRNIGVRDVDSKRR